MWVTIGLSGLLIVLFYLIGQAADWVIINVKKIGGHLGIKHVWLGLLLGILTSMPEFFVGLQFFFKQTGHLSYGNLVGGIVVLIGLIAGLSALWLGKLEVESNFSKRNIFSIIVFLGLPVWLAADGNLSWLDGLLMIALYGFLVSHLIDTKDKLTTTVQVEPGANNLRSIIYMMMGLATIMVLSNFIMDVTMNLINRLGIPNLLAGLVIFSIGTNLPEITLAVSAWRSRARDLSLGNLLGSAMANVLVLGLLSFIKPVNLPLGSSFIFLAGVMLMLLTSFMIFSSTAGSINRREGAVLVMIYLFFVAGIIFNGLL
ncbi:MAG: sodium:calcium antiporter [Patescibacteria group bacterium]